MKMSGADMTGQSRPDAGLCFDITCVNVRVILNEVHSLSLVVDGNRAIFTLTLTVEALIY